MSTTDRRVEELLDRWQASVELHLRYLKLDDAAYARAEAWPKHQRPNALVVNLARTPAGIEGTPQRAPRRGRREIRRVARTDVVPDQPARIGAHRALHTPGDGQGARHGHLRNGGAAAGSCGRQDHYDRQIKDLRIGGQEEFHRLLNGEGAALKKAVISALGYLGWGRVVDVDEYWKNTIRSKEEDIWVIEPSDLPIEAGLRKGDLVLALVLSGKNWAADDECGLLQKFKGRRMQEFDNTKMKAVLVGNYHSGTEAKARPNPFSAAQIEEAQKDGNGLLTSYELFRAIKAEKENRNSKDAIREQIRLKTGLITFDI